LAINKILVVGGGGVWTTTLKLVGCGGAAKYIFVKRQFVDQSLFGKITTGESKYEKGKDEIDEAKTKILVSMNSFFQQR